MLINKYIDFKDSMIGENENYKQKYLVRVDRLKTFLEKYDTGGVQAQVGVSAVVDATGGEFVIRAFASDLELRKRMNQDLDIFRDPL